MTPRPLLSVFLTVGCLAAWNCSRQEASNPDSQSKTSKAMTAIEGEWNGSWGAGLTPGGGIMQPVLASMTVRGDHILIEGFRQADHVDGTVKIDGDRIVVTPAGNAASAQTYTYRFEGDSLLLFDRDNIDTTLHRKVADKRPIVTDANGVALP